MLARTIRAVRHNAVAWLALFIALTGTSIAATHYVITSTHQIKPSVLKALRSAHGPAGSAGREGPAGKEGASGKEGAVGKPGLKGETGEKGERGERGPRGEAGEKGAGGEAGKNGSAIAYAHVEAGGSVEPGEDAIGFAGVTVENPKKEGIYCITGLEVERHNIVVTVDSKETEEPTFATATIGQSKFAHKESICSAAGAVTVETWQRSGGAKGTFETVNEPFFIAIN